MKFFPAELNLNLNISCCIKENNREEPQKKRRAFKKNCDFNPFYVDIILWVARFRNLFKLLNKTAEQ